MKRSLSLLLALVLTLQTLPMAVLATETTAPTETTAETVSTQPTETEATEETTETVLPTEETVPETTEPEETVAEMTPLETDEETLSQEPVMATSGKCGDNLTWELTNGILTIKGTGEMSYRSSKAPWADYCKNIEKVIIESGVQSIEQEAFVNCNNLQDVILPDTISVIGYYAFSNCSKLSDISIPKGVFWINMYAFLGCTNLKGIWVDEENTTYRNDESGVLFLIEEKEEKLCMAPGAIKGHYSIPDTVTTINVEAFIECNQLLSVSIPSSVNSIWPYTFANCRKLTSITIPKSVTSIGEGAFYGCSSLSDVYYDGSKEEWESITIGASNGELHNATVHYNSSASDGDEPAVVKRISKIIEKTRDADYSTEYHFDYDSINLLHSIRYVYSSGYEYTEQYTYDDYKRYISNSSKSSVYTYYDGVGEPGPLHTWSGRTMDCPFIHTYYYNDSGSLSHSIYKQDYDFWIDYSYSIVEKTTYICDSQNRITQSQTTSEFNSDITTTYYSYDSQGRLTAKNSILYDYDNYKPFVAELGYYHDNLVIQDVVGHPIWELASGAIATGKMDIKTDDDGYVTHVQNDGYSWEITYEEAEVDGDDGTVDTGTCGRMLSWLYDKKTEIMTISGSGDMYDYAPPAYTPWTGKRFSSIIMEDGITSIGEWAFAHSDISRIDIPNSITDIGDFAFREVIGLTTVSLPNKLKTINYGVFWNCLALSSVIIPNNITTIEDYAFYGCANLKDVYYGGTEEEWNKVKIGSKNTSLKNATIHFVPLYQLEVYKQDGVFAVSEGDTLFFDVYLLKDGSEISDWECPAIKIADENICSYSIAKNDDKYRVRIQGISIGQTQISITETDSGATIDVPITVLYDLDGINSYRLDAIPKFYPNSKSDGHLLTNFYNHRGIYINNFKYSHVESTNSYRVSMNAYNLNYYHGAIDVYDAKGNWIKCYQITKFSDISSIRDMIDYVCKTMDAGENFLAYDSGMVGEETKLTFDVPDGGFFTISNNIRVSIGTFLYNICDMLLFTLSTTLDVADAHAGMNKDLVEEIFGKMGADEVFRDTILDLMWDFNANTIGEYVKKADAANALEDTLDAVYDILKSNMSIEGVLSGILGVEETVLTNMGGPTGWGINTIFSAAEYNNYILQISCMLSAPYTSPIYIYCYTKNPSDSIFGVEVMGELPDNCILQVNPIGSGLEDIVNAYIGLNLTRQSVSYECDAYSLQLISNNSIYSPENPVQISVAFDSNTDTVRDVMVREHGGEWKIIDYQIVDGKISFTANTTGTIAIIYNPKDDDFPNNTVTRLKGSDRFKTAFRIADIMKEVLNIQKFDTMIIASGMDSADALAGSYLAAMKQAPILLSRDKAYVRNWNLDYIQKNLAPDGIVYILGGTGAVPQEMEDLLIQNGIRYERVKGSDRFGTNIEILKKAGGIQGNEILVSTAYDFADSLSASATGKPILLVNSKRNTLNNAQKAYLAEITANGPKTFTIIGGTGAVSDELATALSAYGTVNRVKGSGREATSVKVAETYFQTPETVFLAYSKNFPDGLCGGPLAYTMDAPLLLVRAKYESPIAAYTEENGITTAHILGGAGAVPDEVARKALNLPDDYLIEKLQ